MACPLDYHLEYLVAPMRKTLCGPYINSPTPLVGASAGKLLAWQVIHHPPPPGPSFKPFPTRLLQPPCANPTPFCPPPPL